MAPQASVANQGGKTSKMTNLADAGVQPDHRSPARNPHARPNRSNQSPSPHHNSGYQSDHQVTAGHTMKMMLEQEGVSQGAAR